MTKPTSFKIRVSSGFNINSILVGTFAISKHCEQLDFVGSAEYFEGHNQRENREARGKSGTFNYPKNGV